MKYFAYLIIPLSISFLSFSPVDDSSEILTTNCHQTFHFFFLAKGSPTFWIGEDLSGECHFSRLLHIGIQDSIAAISQSELRKYKNWGNIPELKSLFNIYDEKPLQLNGEIWENEELKIEPPAYDSLLAEEFNNHIRKGGSNAITWNAEKGNEGIELPKIEGVHADLLFSFKPSLYFNYDIQEVHYFPGSYLLVFTHQPVKAVGQDTMHGFLIFKIKNS